MSRNVIILISALLAKLALKQLGFPSNARAEVYLPRLGLTAYETHPFLLAWSTFHLRIHILRSSRSQYSTWLKFLLPQTYPI
jgi:hypothetical protein